MSPLFSLGSLLPGDAGITQTVNMIKQAVHFAVRIPDIRARAESVIASCPERDELCEVHSIFKWARAHMRYVRDPKGLEFVKSPEVVDREIRETGKSQGDCDDMVTYLAALYHAIGYGVRLVVIAPEGKVAKDGGPALDFSHIYLKVYLPKRKMWMNIEATGRAKRMGWAPGSMRKREYDL